MKIEEAILRLENTFSEGEAIIDRETDEAAKLGIEALKRVKAYKEAHVGLHYTPLPGEDKP